MDKKCVVVDSVIYGKLLVLKNATSAQDSWKKHSFSEVIGDLIAFYEENSSKTEDVP